MASIHSVMIGSNGVLYSELRTEATLGTHLYAYEILSAVI